MKKLISLSLCIVILTSCASIFNGRKARVVLQNDAITEPVDLTVDGVKYTDILLPARVKIKRGFKDSRIVAEAKGYTPSSVDIHKKFNGTTLWNIFLGGIPVVIDAATGAIMKPQFNSYYLNMQPSVPQNYVEDPTIVDGEASKSVSRDNPGQTALERTTLRWYFDSDPRGARIYWRVISNIPNIVKNTNETYLMTTPFEETRSFNILGLTYENSRDVQIEIKVSKKGYEDQVKRFNVRQAIDQQEISGFFEMVEKEE